MRIRGMPKCRCCAEKGSLRRFLLPVHHSFGRHLAFPTRVFPCSAARQWQMWISLSEMVKQKNVQQLLYCALVVEGMDGGLGSTLAALSVSVLCVCACSKGSNCLLDGSIYLSVFITCNKLMFRTGWWNLHLKESIIKDFFLWLHY